MRWIGVVGDADELLDEVVGSVQQRKRNVLTRTGKMRKESRLNSVWLKERYKFNKYNIINHFLIRLETLILRLPILWLLFILNNLLILRHYHLY